MASKSFLFRADWLPTLDQIPREERLAYYEEIVRYATDGSKPPDTAHEAVLAPIFAQIEEDRQRARDVLQRRKDGGKLGGRPRKPKTAPEEKQQTPPVEQPEEKPRPMFLPYFERVRSIRVPVPLRADEWISRQYKWRAAEGMTAFMEAVDTAIESGLQGEALFSSFKSLTDLFKPKIAFGAFRLAAMMTTGLREYQIKAVAAEVDDSLRRREKDIWKTICEKVEYLKNPSTRVHNIRSFLKTRPTHGNK